MSCPGYILVCPVVCEIEVIRCGVSTLLNWFLYCNSSSTASFYRFHNNRRPRPIFNGYYVSSFSHAPYAVNTFFVIVGFLREITWLSLFSAKRVQQYLFYVLSTFPQCRSWEGVCISINLTECGAHGIVYPNSTRCPGQSANDDDHLYMTRLCILLHYQCCKECRRKLEDAIY